MYRFLNIMIPHSCFSLACALAVMASGLSTLSANVHAKHNGAKPAMRSIHQPTVVPRTSSTGPPRYTVIEVGRSAWGLAIPNDINNRGVIVGEWDSGTRFGSGRHAVVWRDGVMIDLTPGPGINFASAHAINDNGVATGYYITDGSSISGGFRWRHDVFEILPTFAVGHQQGRGINQRGFIVGVALHATFQTNAAAWDRRLNEYNLGNLGQGTGLAHGVNDWNAVVGGTGITLNETHAFLWQDGTMHDIGTLPGHTVARAQAINNHNEVVGYSGGFFDDHAFHWTRETGMIDLGSLGSAPGSTAEDINDAGVIVGSSSTRNSSAGVVWHDFVLYDLNQLLVNGQGWRLEAATAINDRGQIVGYGVHNGAEVAYLASPVEVPMATVIGPTPGLAGAPNEIELVSASPGARVLVMHGTQPGATRIDGWPTAVVSIADAQKHEVVADDSGRASLPIYLPESARGKRLLVQAVDLSNGHVTNLIVRTLD